MSKRANVVTGRSEWDDGRGEWEEAPRRSSHSRSRRHVPSSSPMYFGASPSDNVAPSATPIRASGSSGRSSNTRSEAPEVEIEYDSDRAWYDRDEGMSGMYDGGEGSGFLGDEASFQEKEAELLAKRLVGMTLGQSNKLSDDAQLEVLQLMKNWEVEIDFDNKLSQHAADDDAQLEIVQLLKNWEAEIYFDFDYFDYVDDEFLLDHAPIVAPFSEPVPIPKKQPYPTSHMDINEWKFLEECRIRCEIVENLRMKRRRQLSGSKLGVEKTAQHLKKGGNKNRNKQLRKIETRLFDDISQA